MSQITAALVARPAAVTPKQTPKLAGTRQKPAQDTQEHEADRIASKAASGAGAPAAPPSSSSSPSGETPPAHALDVVQEAGHPLEAAVRSEMSTRLGHDFSRVRIHTSGEAAASASRLQARAYTIGSHVVFNSGRYDPRSREGRELLAHELTHVMQQAVHGSHAPAIQFKKEEQPAPGKFYQEVIDNVEYEKKEYARRQKESGIGFHNINYDSLKLLLSLCEAVDQNQWDVVPTRLDKLLEKGLMVPFLTISESLLNELSARIFEMGLEADAQRLRKAYSDDKKNFSIASIDDSISRRNIQFYTRLIDGAAATASTANPEDVDKSIHKFVRAFFPLRDAYLAIDQEALKWEQQSGSGWMVLRPGMSHEEWYRAVIGQLAHWLGALSAYVQQAEEAARADFENNGGTGTGAALLEHLLKAFNTEINDAFFPADSKQNIAGLTFDITKTTLGKGKGTSNDFFATGKEASKRSVAITTYDPAQEYTPELRTSLAGFFRIRVQQIRTLGRIYGDLNLLKPNKDFGEGMKAAEESSDNAASIKKLAGGRLRLDSDDDWRNFLLQKYRDMTSPAAPPPGSDQPQPHTYKPAEALHTIIDLLFAYLKAFTVHARFTNIYDTGEISYLNRPFPRALTGQLVHDCGVYALRVAYMLSLLRKELGLRFRFVMLPVHVSLVISGENLPTYFIENDNFDEIPPENMERIRKDWDAYKDPGSATAPAGAHDDNQFIGEFAAAEFIPGPLDMPFKVVEVPKPVSDSKTEQAQLWDFYRKNGSQDVFGSSSQDKNSPNYLFHKNYLALTEEIRQIHNEVVLTFWNKQAPAAWDKLQKAMSADNTRTRLSVSTLTPLLTTYKDDYAAAFKPVDDRYKSFRDKEKSIGKSLRADPKLAKSGVSYTYGLRAATLWTYYWDSHQRHIADYLKDLATRKPDAEEELQAVTSTLDPFFEPMPDKAVEPLN